MSRISVIFSFPAISRTRPSISPAGTDVTEINEKQIARFRRENLGFVFQDFNLLDTLTISENIALALTIKRFQQARLMGGCGKWPES